MKEANLKGCHPIQNLGAVETYQRRYLWTALMEIVEHDALDGAAPLDSKPATSKPAPAKKTVAKKAAPKKAAAKKAPPVEDDFIDPNDYAEIADDEEADRFTGFMIKTAREMHSDSMENLMSFWKKNLEAINYLNANFND